MKRYWVFREEEVWCVVKEGMGCKGSWRCRGDEDGDVLKAKMGM